MYECLTGRAAGDAAGSLHMATWTSLNRSLSVKSERKFWFISLISRSITLLYYYFFPFEVLPPLIGILKIWKYKFSCKEFSLFSKKTTLLLIGDSWLFNCFSQRMSGHHQVLQRPCIFGALLRMGWVSSFSVRVLFVVCYVQSLHCSCMCKKHYVTIMTFIILDHWLLSLLCCHYFFVFLLSCIQCIWILML